MANVLFTNARIFDGTGAQPYTGEVLVQGNRIARVGRSAALDCPAAARSSSTARGATLMPGPGRGAHAFLVERPAGPLRDPAHADRGAHPLVRAHREALSRHGLHVVRRRGHREAAPRRRDPQRDRVGTDSRAALSRGEPGDHGAGRARRRDAAAPAVSGVQLRRGGQRRRGDAQVRAHVPEVRRRHDQAQPVGRVHRRHSGRVHADDRRRDRDRGQGSAYARQARRRARALERVGQAVRAPRHRAHLPRELRRRGSARHARGGEGPALRRARHRVARQHVAITPPSGASRPRSRRTWATTASSRSRARRCRR